MGRQHGQAGEALAKRIDVGHGLAHLGLVTRAGHVPGGQQVRIVGQVTDQYQRRVTNWAARLDMTPVSPPGKYAGSVTDARSWPVSNTTRPSRCSIT